MTHETTSPHSLLFAPAFLMAQGGRSIRADILKPLEEQWTSYSGDFTGKRFSAPQARQHQHRQEPQPQVGRHRHHDRLRPDRPSARRRTVARRLRRTRRRGGGGGPAPIIVGGLGNGEANNCGPARLGGGILFVDGIIYASSPDNVWAIDARDGAVLWHYYWKTRGGTSLQTRGLGMWHNYIYFELHDDWVVCLDAKTGKEVWKKEIASFDAQYFSSNAPMILGNHVIVGTGNDMDSPGYIKSFDPRNRRAAVDLLLDAAESGRSRPRNLGEPRRRPPRRRHDLDPRLVRSRDAALHLRHRQPDARLHHRPRRRRQSVHLLADRGERRYRQDGLVLPDLAARHARLGLHPDADLRRHAVQRTAAQARHDRRRATATSSSSTASPASTC